MAGVAGGSEGHDRPLTTRTAGFIGPGEGLEARGSGTAPEDDPLIGSSSGARATRREDYFAVMMKWPRRFCAQHSSVFSVQNGASSPLLIVRIRSAATPRLTR